MYFLDVGETQVVGSSPEILARQQQVVTVRPIAGTRPRGKTEAEDCWKQNGAAISKSAPST